MLRKIGLLLQWLIAGAFTLVLAACYGPPVRMATASIKYKVENEKSEPIEGIMVEFKSVSNKGGFAVYTDQEGIANCNMSAGMFANLSEYEVNLIDIDGTNNGQYKALKIFPASTVSVSTNFTLKGK